jgi:hypothetical protein
MLQEYVPLWQKQCIDGGCSLTPCHFQPSALAQYPVNTDYTMSVCSTECDRSNIFVCFLKEENSQYVYPKCNTLQSVLCTSRIARKKTFVIRLSNGSRMEILPSEFSPAIVVYYDILFGMYNVLQVTKAGG